MTGAQLLSHPHLTRTLLETYPDFVLRATTTDARCVPPRLGIAIPFPDARQSFLSALKFVRALLTLHPPVLPAC